jgi:hypothetical protein
MSAAGVVERLRALGEDVTEENTEAEMHVIQ